MEEDRLNEPREATPQSTSIKAILSLVSAALGVFCLWILGSIPAIILGLWARRDIRESGGRIKGNELALIGIILGAFSFVFSCVPLMVAIAIPNFLEAQSRAKIARVKADLRTIATGIELYQVDHNQLPSTLFQLTTPIEYLTKIPPNVFSAGSIYDYQTNQKSSWIVRSQGPDRDADMDLSEALQHMDELEMAQWMSRDWIYDPTNGTKSSGDIIRIGAYPSK